MLLKDVSKLQIRPKTTDHVYWVFSVCQALWYLLFLCDLICAYICRINVCVCVLIDLENFWKAIPLKCLLLLQWLPLKGKGKILIFAFSFFPSFFSNGKEAKAPKCQKDSCQMIRVTDTKARKLSQIDKEQSKGSGFRQGSRACLE